MLENYSGNLYPTNQNAVKDDSSLTNPFFVFLQTLWNRTGKGTGIPLEVNTGLVASGSTQADALQLNVDLNEIETASAGNGVVLLPLNVGQWQEVANGSGVDIKVYPAPGYEIDGTGVNVPFVLASGVIQVFTAWKPAELLSLNAAPVFKANTKYFVNPAGSDNNTGLATGPANAFQTIQHAVDVIHQSLAIGGSIIQLDDGTYNVGAGVLVTYAMQGGEIVILGNPVTPANVVVVGTTGSIIFNVQEPATVSIAHMAIDGSAANCVGIAARQFSTIDIGDVTFLNFTAGITISATNHSSIGIVGDLTWVGNFGVGIDISDQSFFSCTSFTFNVPAVTATDFIVVQDLSKVNAGVTVIDAGLTATNSYFVDYNSILRLNGTTFPGSGGPFSGHGSFVV